jgi:D-alanyl-D-alanine carboxypeptidase (penicillin-binding protein 5/6)
MDPRGFDIQNDNQLLFDYPGAIGGKTGFTDVARHTYVGAAERGGRRLVVALMGAENQPGRGWQQGAALLDWGFAVPRGSNVGRLVEPGESSPEPPSPQQRAPAAAATRPVAPVALPSMFLLMLGAVVGALGAVMLIWLAGRRRRAVGRRRGGGPRRPFRHRRAEPPPGATRSTGRAGSG